MAPARSMRPRLPRTTVLDVLFQEGTRDSRASRATTWPSCQPPLSTTWSPASYHPHYRLRHGRRRLARDRRGLERRRPARRPARRVGVLDHRRAEHDHHPGSHDRRRERRGRLGAGRGPAGLHPRGRRPGVRDARLAPRLPPGLPHAGVGGLLGDRRAGWRPGRVDLHPERGGVGGHGLRAYVPVACPVLSADGVGRPRAAVYASRRVVRAPRGWTTRRPGEWGSAGPRMARSTSSTTSTTYFHTAVSPATVLDVHVYGKSAKAEGFRLHTPGQQLSSDRTVASLTGEVARLGRPQGHARPPARPRRARAG